MAIFIVTIPVFVITSWNLAINDNSFTEAVSRFTHIHTTAPRTWQKMVQLSWVSSKVYIGLHVFAVCFFVILGCFSVVWSVSVRFPYKCHLIALAVLKAGRKIYNSVQSRFPPFYASDIWFLSAYSNSAITGVSFLPVISAMRDNSALGSTEKSFFPQFGTNTSFRALVLEEVWRQAQVTVSAL